MPKLTKRSVGALKPDPRGKSDMFEWDAGDGALKGFGVRVKPSGVATYIVQYRNKEGRTRRLALGKVGTLTPEEARSLAGDVLKTVSKGGDPSAERHAVRGAITVGELCDLYLADARGRIKDSTLAMDRSRIETHVKPLIGRLTVRSLTSSDVERMKASIVAGKTAKPRSENGRGGATTGGPGVASRTVGMLGTILEYARQSLKLIKANPARGVKRPADGKQQRFLRIEEIELLGRAITEAAQNGDNRTGLAAIEFLLLTGLRRMEALSLRRDWIDNRSRCIRFPDTKSGPKIRPIGAEAVKLLNESAVKCDHNWVFPADRGDGHFVGIPKVLARVCGRAGIKGVTVHVLRHSFAAVAAEMGYSELTIAGMLGHSVQSVTARYAHVPDSALVAAADRVSARIAAALAGKGSADVVPFRGGQNG